MPLKTDLAWSEALAVLRRHGGLLLPVYGLFVLLPGLAIALLLPSSGPDNATPQQALELLRAYYLANIHWLVLSALSAALAHGAILSLLASADRPTVAQALGRGLVLMPAFFLYAMLTQLAVGMGLVLLVLPGLYLLGRLALGDVWMAAHHRLNPLRAAGESWSATQRNGLRLGVVIALVYVVGMIATIAAGSIVGVFAVLLAGAEAGASTRVIVATLVGTLVQLLTLLFRYAAWRQLAGSSSGM